MTASRGRIRIGFGNKAGVDITALYLPGFIYRSGSIITLRHLLLSNCFLIELNVIDLPFRDLYPGDQRCVYFTKQMLLCWKSTSSLTTLRIERETWNNIFEKVLYWYLLKFNYLLLNNWTVLQDSFPFSATCFRLAKSYDQCKDCFHKAADCHKQARSWFHAAKCYEQVSFMYFPRHAYFFFTLPSGQFNLKSY